MKQFKVKLGSIVKDLVTNFQGVAVARTVWLNGCVRILVQQQGVDDKFKTIDLSVDEDQLSIINEDDLLPTRILAMASEAPPVSSAAISAIMKGPGGPFPDAERQPDITR